MFSTLFSSAIGIIPALAGNIVFLLFVWWCGWDHPRACGEHIAISWWSDTHQGSSPRLRGTFAFIFTDYITGGIIPALAGNMCPSPIPFVLSWDHPRACGEHWNLVLCDVGVEGSSPRLRGTSRS